MRQLLFEGPGTVRWSECDAPSLDGVGKQDAAIVRPIAVALCDLDVGALRGSFPLPGPYPLGHEGIGEVIAIGENVSRVAVGDRVVVPFQISCGECESCQKGRTGNCRSHPPLSTFGLGTMGGLAWGGLLADQTLVPHADFMLVRVPDGLDPVAVASMSDNIPDGWRCVGPQLAAEPGAPVLIVSGQAGPHSIGLYAAGLAVTAGSERVVYHDDNPERLAIAERLGAEPLEGLPTGKVGKFPITVDASGSPDGLQCAIQSTAFDGTCTSPSVYFEDPTIPMFSMYSRCCTLHTGRAHALPAIPAAFDLIARGFDPSLVTTEVVTFDEAEAALADPSMKPILVQA